MPSGSSSRTTTRSPKAVGRLLKRRSIVRHASPLPIVTVARPSCGTRRSATSMRPITFSRLAIGPASFGATSLTSRSAPSTRIRMSTRSSRGCTCTSLAPRVAAVKSIQSTSRTTGALPEVASRSRSASARARSRSSSGASMTGPVAPSVCSSRSTWAYAASICSASACVSDVSCLGRSPSLTPTLCSTVAGVASAWRTTSVSPSRSPSTRCSRAKSRLMSLRKVSQVCRVTAVTGSPAA